MNVETLAGQIPHSQGISLTKGSTRVEVTDFRHRDRAGRGQVASARRSSSARALVRAQRDRAVVRRAGGLQVARAGQELGPRGVQRLVALQPPVALGAGEYPFVDGEVLAAEMVTATRG